MSARDKRTVAWSATRIERTAIVRSPTRSTKAGPPIPACRERGSCVFADDPVEPKTFMKTMGSMTKSGLDAGLHGLE
jgi:hypothetical protein